MLTESQKIMIRELLGVKSGADVTIRENYGFQILESRLDALNDGQISFAEDILAEYEKVRFKTGTLSGEYSDNPAARRQLLRGHMITCVGFDPANYGGASGLSIGRA